MKKLSLLLLFSFFITGCLLPQPPHQSLFSKVEYRFAGDSEIYTYKSKEVRFSYQKTSTLGTDLFQTKAKLGKNLLFVVADSYIQDFLKPKAGKELKNLPEHLRLEDLTWWYYSPLFKDIYNEVYRTTYAGARYDVIEDAIEYLESKNQPYDIIFLTHGFPNHITSGEDYFLSWKEIAGWKDQLKNLDLVFMQGCFGNTLNKDWLQAGAKSVISYPGFNRNFFYLSSFLKWYRWAPDNPQLAYEKANESLEKNINSSFFYKGIIKKILGMSVKGYIEMSGVPGFDSLETQYADGVSF